MLFFRQLQIIRHFFGWTLLGFSCLFAICAIHNKRSLGYGAPVHCFFRKKPDALERAALRAVAGKSNREKREGFASLFYWP